MLFAVLVDLRGPSTERRPFAAADIETGTRLSPQQVVWRDVPRGLLPQSVPAGAFTVRPVGRGEPLLPGALGERPPSPDGWWSVELRVPAGAEVGAQARIVVRDPPLATDGVVVSLAAGGAFDSFRTGMVAVPPQHADAIARASTGGQVTVLVSQ